MYTTLGNYQISPSIFAEKNLTISTIQSFTGPAPTSMANLAFTWNGKWSRGIQTFKPVDEAYTRIRYFTSQQASSRNISKSNKPATTRALKVKVIDGSGKIRDGGVSDEPKDKDNDEVTSRIWTGVVPVWETFGQPVPSAENKITEVPEHITSFIASKNAQNRALAEGAIEVDLPSEEQH